MQQQTAVDYLIEMIRLNNKEFYAMLFEDGVFEQAKVMEADQSDRDYNQGFSNGYSEVYDKGMSDYNRF